MKRRWGFFAAGAMLAAGIVYLLFASEKARRVARKVIQGAGILLARLHEQGPTVVILWIRDHLLRRIQGMSPADTSCVAQRLYVGGQHARHGLGRLAALNITASVSLRQESDDTERGVALERHLWLPTVDDTPPALEQLDQAAGFVRQAIQDGRGVYVHCASGIGRAPTTAAAYLVSIGMTPAEAWAQIRRRRPFIRPKAGQVEQLERFYQWKRQ